ncbi:MULTISPECIES: bacillithiol system redox-active protein YtxJ [Robiginitalea]|nr:MULTISPECIES: bacillithiol system redox-active protein YtxJ [Robiginitalea]MDC6354249.1 bacillithiol system redox-active protein YtxJ [Robiginitalea sp. PM2]MDC6374516.1 bacillithiol system redox-active protein YtxJ [Robiginitalea sp. SP8]
MFGNLFGSGDNTEGESRGGFPWNNLEDPEGEALFNAVAEGGLQVVFKHSNSCGISRIMLGRFQGLWPAGAAEFFLIDVKRNRPLSDLVAGRFGCTHQSPQVLVIRDGELVAHASHGAIESLDPEEFPVG